MPLSATNFVANGHLIHQDLQQFVDLFTGAMTDQPVTFGNNLIVAGGADIGGTFQAEGVSIFVGQVTFNAPIYAPTLGTTGSQLNFATGGQPGTNRWRITATNFGASVDNTYDIGATTANRPRNVYVGSTLNVTGNIGIGTNGASPQAALNITYATTTGGYQMGVDNELVADAAALHVYGFYSVIGTTGPGTVNEYAHFYADYCNVGYQSSITNVYGLFVSNQGGGGTVTNQYGVYISPQSSAAGRNVGLYNGGVTELAELASPPTPAPTILRLYPKSDHKLYIKDSSGLETQLGGGITIPLSQNLTWTPDATYDIGATANFRPRNVYVGGTLAVTGLSTLTGGATLGSALTFATDNSFDIGANGANRPRNLFVGGVFRVAGGISGTGSMTEFRNATTPQVLRLYNTYTDASNYEAFEMSWGANQITIHNINAGTGSARPWIFDSGSNTFFLTSGSAVRFQLNAATKWGVEGAAGHMVPGADITYDLGWPTQRVRDVYAGHALYVGSTNERLLNPSTNTANLSIESADGIIYGGALSGLRLMYNGYSDGTNYQRFSTSAMSSRFSLDGNGFAFYAVAAGSGVINFGNPKLTMDLNGNLAVSSVSAPGSSTGPRFSASYSVANGAVAQAFPGFPNSQGMLLVNQINVASLALIYLRGGAAQAVMMTNTMAGSPNLQFSVVAGTASSTNVYWSAANSRYEIQNLTGSSQTYTVLFFQME